MSALTFIGADELRSVTPAEPPWILDGYLAPGAVTLLAKKPKAGGSTLAVSMAEAVALGAPSFLGHAVSGGPVVYVSEESASTFAHKVPATGVIRVLTRDAAWPKPSWGDLVAAARKEAERVGAVLLVIDTGRGVEVDDQAAGLRSAATRAPGAWSAVAEGERTDSRALVDELAIVAALKESDEGLTRTELEKAIGAPQRQWHAPLYALLASGRVARTGKGKKGSPYRFKLSENAARKDAAQKARRNGQGDASFSAAPPIGGQHKRAFAAASPNGARGDPLIVAVGAGAANRDEVADYVARHRERERRGVWQ